jgi:hypothetical protein
MQTLVRRRRKRGPRPAFDGPAVTLYARIPENLAARLDEVVDQRRTTRAAFVRDLVTGALQQEGA